MTIPAFSMDFGRLDDLDRRILARDLALAAKSTPVLAGLAAAARDCAGHEGPLTYEIGTAGSDLAEVGPALEAMYEAARANGAAVKVPLLRLLGAWTTWAQHGG